MTIVNLAVVTTIVFAWYVLLCRKMKKENVPSPPILSYFWLFIVYGSLSILLLNQVLRRGDGIDLIADGIDLIGLVLHLYIAPVSTLILTIHLHSQRKVSLYHFWACMLSLICVFLPILVLVIIASLR